MTKQALIVREFFQRLKCDFSRVSLRIRFFIDIKLNIIHNEAYFQLARTTPSQLLNETS